MNDTAIELIEATDDDFAWMLGERDTSGRTYSLPPGGVDHPIILAIVRNMTRDLRAGECAGSWMVVCNGEVVGLCSYRRPPVDGLIEIGYGTAESRRRLGHATRAVAAMLRIAGGDPLIHTIIAETSVHNPTSARVLVKNGFVQTGTRVHPDDGDIVIWGLPRS